MKTALFLFSFGLTSVFSFSNRNDGAGKGEPTCDIRGQCINSDLVGIRQARNSQECLAHCQNKDNCKWYTFEPLKDLCELFQFCTELDEETCPSCLSGQVECEFARCGIQGLCQGTLLREETKQSPEECLRECQSMDQCRWYSYDRSYETCFLFSNCPTLDANVVTSTSGETRCSLLGRVLIVTGNFNDGMPQVVDLLDSSVSCELLPNFTNSTWTIDDAAGGLLNEDIPLVCGGNPFSNNTGPKLDECYIVGKPEAGVVAKMETPKSYTAFAVIRGFDTTKDKLFIAGGLINNNGDNGGPLATTEYIRPGEDSVPGPDLPLATSDGSLIQLNDSTLLMIGGTASSGVRTNTYYFDIETEAWTPGPELPLPKSDFAVAMMQSSQAFDGAKLVVVAGGRCESVTMDTTDILNLETNSWIEGPVLYKNVSNAWLVPSPDGEGVILIGGDLGTEILEMRCQGLSCQWKPMEQRLKYPRYDAIVMYIPDYLTYCYPNPNK